MRKVNRWSVLLLGLFAFGLAAFLHQTPMWVTASSPAPASEALITMAATQATEEEAAEETEGAEEEPGEAGEGAETEDEAATEDEAVADDAAETEEAEDGNPFTGDEEAIEEGQQLYVRVNCYACHGREGGGGMGPSLVDARWNFGSDDATVFETIHDGRGGMPAFGDILEDEEIWKVIAFIRSIYQGSPESVNW